MDVQELLCTSLADMADGNIYPLQKPVEDDPDVFIVYNPEMIAPEDFGDDEEQEWVHIMQVHYYARGRVDYEPAMKDLRRKLKAAGFMISEIRPGYEAAADTSISGVANSKGYTRIDVSCEIVEGDSDGIT